MPNVKDYYDRALAWNEARVVELRKEQVQQAEAYNKTAGEDAVTAEDFQQLRLSRVYAGLIIIVSWFVFIRALDPGNVIGLIFAGAALAAAILLYQKTKLPSVLHKIAIGAGSLAVISVLVGFAANAFISSVLGGSFF